jgi:hypothetical protein
MSALLRNRIAALGRHFAPKDFTGFINAPSSQAQDHLLEAKRPGCCWWARLDQVMCGMDGCEANESERHHFVARTLRTVALWEILCLSYLDGVMR